MIDVNKVISWESVELSEEETIEFFQELVDSGAVWKLQGCYGRTAMDLLEAGLIKFPKKRTYDYYGNPIPIREEMELK